jgi:TonB family protein
MASHPDILDEQERLHIPLLGSVALHTGIAALILAYYALGGGSRVERWGDPLSLGGGAVGITPVDKIPLPAREGRINPLANETESQIPSEPAKPEPKKAREPEPEAVPFKSRNAKKTTSKKETAQQRYSPVKEPKPTQVYSRTGQAVTSPMFSQAPGGGGVGSGSTSPFGNRFGWYEQILREKVARNWRSQDLDSAITNPVVVTFEILRSGAVQEVRVTRSSNNFAMDQSAQRAILMSSPFPPLPPQFERDSAVIEFWFRLQQ